MSLVRVHGGFWVPTLPPTISQGTTYADLDTALLDADEEEIQMIGYVCLAAGSGSKTFGGGSSTLGWLPGPSIAFVSSSTLTVGAKKASTFDNTTGPAGRATIGAGAFDVYLALVGGTDTITSTTWREDAMSSGTPFSVAHGDKIAICFHLDVVSGTQAIVVRINNISTNKLNMPFVSLVTTGPTTYTDISLSMPMCCLTFSDGTLGWIDPCPIFSDSNTDVVIGNTNLYGNIIKFPFDCAVDAIATTRIIETGTTNFDIGLWSDPADTPTAMTNGTVSVDPQNLGTTSGRYLALPLPAEISLSKNTAYFAAVKQNSASSIRIGYFDVDAIGHLQSSGLDENTYAGLSTAGGAVAQQNSGKRRAGIYVRISSVDVGGVQMSRVLTGM